VPLDEGGGRGKPKPVTRRPPKLPTKKKKGRAPRPDELAFGADVGLFTPPALVDAAPPVVGERDKVPVPFPIAPTPQQARISREQAARKTRQRRARDAVVAPVSTAARVRVRRGETKTEKRARTGTQPKPSGDKGYRTGDIGDFFSSVVEGLGDAGGHLVRAAAEGLISAGWQADEGRQVLPGGDVTAGALAGAEAGVNTLAAGTVGLDLARAATGQEYDPTGLKIDAALLPFLAIGAPFKGLRAARAAAKAARAGKRGEDVLDEAADAYRGVANVPRGVDDKPVFSSVANAQRTIDEADAYLLNPPKGGGQKNVDDVLRWRDEAERYVAAKQLDPEIADTRLTELETFLAPFIDDAYTAIRQMDPSSTIGLDKRVRRQATDADRAKTHAIGVGDPVDMSDAPLIRPQIGPDVDRDRAERVIYEAAQRASSPVAKRIVEAFDEIEAINNALTYRAEADFLAALDPYQAAATREAEAWTDELAEQVEQERAALTAVDDTGGVPPEPPPPVTSGPDDFSRPPRRRVRGLDAPYQPRTLRSGNLTQQLPKTRSRISHAAERVVDNASQALDNTLVKDVPGLRIVTAHARVPKAAGRQARQAALRRPAKVRGALNTVSHLKEGSMDDVAHFWYAQLPASHRNEEGLRLIRDAQAEELENITSERSLKALEDRVTVLRMALSDAETGGEAMRYLNQIEDVKVLITDLPQRAEDVAASITMMEKLIAHAPPVNDDVLDALRTLSNDRKQVLIASGRLDPEKAANRESLVAREFVGLEPDGTEVYLGHRLPKGVDTPAKMSGMSAGTGRVASPKGVGSRNRMVLATTGRLRPSTHVALDDWSAAQVFIQATEARDVLGKLGEPFKNRFKEGYTLINPKGRTVPAHWKTDELAAFSDGPDDIAETRELAQDLINTFASQNQKDMQRIVDEATEQGVHWSELRLVPNYQVERYYKQFRSFAGRSTPAVVYDAMVDAAATSIVFARIGYIPKNVVQNLIMSLPHQGVFFPMNAARAGQVLADPELRFLFQGEIGASGASKAIGNERALKGPTKWALGKVAHFMGSIADDPARMAAFLHEAAAEGVISKVNPLLTNRDRQALKKLLTDPRQRQRLEDIRSRSVEAMADFTRLTPDQARMARRFLIIPGWLMAGSRYPFHFAATHPIRSALMAYILMGEPGAPDELQFNNRIDTYFTGRDYLWGIDTPWGRERTASLNPIGTPFELAAGVRGSVEGREGPFDFETPVAFDVANPFGATAIEWLQGEGDLARTGKRLLPGSYGLGRDLIAPPTDPRTYPEDVTRIGRLKREIGIIPIEVNDEVDDDLIAPPMKRPGSSSRNRPGGRRTAPRPS
jgi:hypothetical protein